MEIPDPLVYLMIFVSLFAGIITIGKFFHNSKPFFKIVPWKRIGLSLTSIFLVFGGIYLLFFGFLVAYLITKFANPESTLGKLSPENFNLLVDITILLALGFFAFTGGMLAVVGILKFLKVTGIAPEKAERIAIKLSKAHILKENVI